MGRASSSKKVSRAAKAAGRPGTSRNLVWPATIGVIVLLGFGLIAVSATGRESASAAPLLGDHWHAAYGVSLCGEFQAPVSDVGPDESGIHSHGDGVIHIHPFSTRYTGSDADLAAFAETTGFELSDDSITMPDGTTVTNGDDCGGEPGIVQVKVWDGPDDPDGRLLESDFGSFALQDGALITIAFAPEGAEIEKPPSTGTQPTDVTPAPGATVPPGAPSTLPTDEGAVDPADEGAGDDADEGAGEDAGDVTGETSETSETSDTSAP